jgi:hypothetical protein
MYHRVPIIKQEFPCGRCADMFSFFDFRIAFGCGLRFLPCRNWLIEAEDERSHTAFAHRHIVLMDFPVLSATDSTCRVTFISLSFYQQLQSRSLVS